MKIFIRLGDGLEYEKRVSSRTGRSWNMNIKNANGDIIEEVGERTRASRTHVAILSNNSAEFIRVKMK